MRGDSGNGLMRLDHKRMESVLDAGEVGGSRLRDGELPVMKHAVGGLVRTGVPFGGIIDDVRRRSRYYLSDWADGICWKTPAGALFMFFATFASTVALGELARSQTDGHIGVTEYLLLQSVAGIVHCLLAGQPLLILRPTGPITVFITELYTLGGGWGRNICGGKQCSLACLLQLPTPPFLPSSHPPQSRCDHTD